MSISESKMQHTALVLLDFQVDVCAKGGKMLSQDLEVLCQFERTIRNAKGLLDGVRNSKNAPKLVHVKHIYQDAYPELENANLSSMESYVKGELAFIEGEPGSEIVEELIPLPGEYVIQKRTLSPFASTELAWWLNKREINTVLLAGVVTHYAVLSTAFSAYDLGFSIGIVSDCCMSGTTETHEIALTILEPIAKLVESSSIIEQIK